MTRPVAHLEIDRTLLRGICLVVKGDRQRFNRLPPVSGAAGAISKFPRRPDVGVLSESIPLFFIGRNNSGFWVAREAEGRTGGIFLLKWSALRFAKKNSTPAGCATMFLAEPFELDVENQGNRLVPWLDALRRGWRRQIPDYPPPMSIGREKFKGEWR
jgi:hypothetical protein